VKGCIPLRNVHCRKGTGAVVMVAPVNSVPPKFDLGRLVATPGALAALERSAESPMIFLARHVGGDWGDLDEHDRAANERALSEGERIFSSYKTGAGEKVWVITEWDRSVTTLLLPEEY